MRQFLLTTGGGLLFQQKQVDVRKSEGGEGGSISRNIKIHKDIRIEKLASFEYITKEWNVFSASIELLSFV